METISPCRPISAASRRSRIRMARWSSFLRATSQRTKDFLGARSIKCPIRFGAGYGRDTFGLPHSGRRSHPGSRSSHRERSFRRTRARPRPRENMKKLSSRVAATCSRRVLTFGSFYDDSRAADRVYGIDACQIVSAAAGGPHAHDRSVCDDTRNLLQIVRIHPCVRWFLHIGSFHSAGSR